MLKHCELVGESSCTCCRRNLTQKDKYDSSVERKKNNEYIIVRARARVCVCVCVRVCMCVSPVSTYTPELLGHVDLLLTCSKHDNISCRHVGSIWFSPGCCTKQ